MRLATIASQAAVLVASMLGAASAHGDDASVTARADRLYAEAQSLRDAGRMQEACDRFRESQRLQPALGALLNVAECDATAGRTASAYLAFVQAAALARSKQEPARVQFAEARAAELAPRLSLVTFVAPGHARIVSLRVDGEAREATPGAPLPIDPGRHHVEATLEVGSVSRDVDVAAGPSRVAVPLVAATAQSQQTPQTATGTAPAQTTAGGARAASADDDASARRRTLGYVLLGTAVAGVATGAVAGIMTLHTASSRCKSDAGGGVVCSSEDELSSRHDAYVTAWIADIGLAVGGLAAAGAAYLLLTPPQRRPPPRAAISVSPAGIAAVGSF